MKTETTYFPKVESIISAAKRLKGIANKTPLTINARYSKEYSCNILLKREDLQQVRSYKIRGAYNKISSLSENEKTTGIVCASAGEYGLAQGARRHEAEAAGGSVR